jgi:AcrR family transcriptional regulator
MSGRPEYPDARVARTRRRLKEALLSLLAERNLRELTVKEVAKRAGVNRVTYYDHYESLEKLLWDLVEDKLAEYASIIELKERPPGTLDAAHQAHMKQVILTVEHIRSNEAFYRVMLLGNGVPQVADRLHERLCQTLLSALARIQPPPRELDLHVYAHWIMGGAISLFKYWLSNDLKLSDAFIIDQLRKMSAASAQALR